ncbi:hypothetical protein [Pendulispora albinea]|uniref:Uncharacterized protein n=1 Tax=Pendulispora albinea TaxID=2741071 RepID=A0ABZ2M861_9BACT
MDVTLQRLGDRIEKEWFRANFRDRSFPSICARALSETRVVDVEALLDWGLGCERLPEQVDADFDFGEPPLTVFSSERFYISVHFWLDGTTNIHEHGFSGAFVVLEGGSLHTTFAFRPAHEINDHFAIGELHEKHVERLEPGDVREIHGNGHPDSTIHSLFHLERPSATLVVRTYRDTRTRPQYSYSRAGAAWNSLYDRKEIKRRGQLLQLVQQTRPDHVHEYCLRWFDVADDVGAFLALRSGVGRLSPDEGNALLNAAELRRPELTRLARDVVAADRCEAGIIRRRSVVTDPGLRFFLAVLLNVRGRENALRLIGEKYRERDPVDTVMEWILALSKLPAIRLEEPSALGFPLDEVTAMALRNLLTGAPCEALEREVATFAKRPLTVNECGALENLRDAFRRSEMFGGVLGEMAPIARTYGG